MHAFAAKLGLALHYDTVGRPMPASGGVAVRWWSNYESLEKKIPAAAMGNVGDARTLKQGSWDVAQQFQYTAQVFERGAIYFATFRFAFAVSAFVADDVSVLEHARANIYRLGCFLGTAEEKIASGRRADDDL